MNYEKKIRVKALIHTMITATVVGLIIEFFVLWPSLAHVVLSWFFVLGSVGFLLYVVYKSFLLHERIKSMKSQREKK